MGLHLILDLSNEQMDHLMGVSRSKSQSITQYVSNVISNHVDDLIKVYPSKGEGEVTG